MEDKRLRMKVVSFWTSLRQRRPLHLTACTLTASGISRWASNTDFSDSWSLGDTHRTSVATLPTDVVLEDTQPFSQPSGGCSLRAHHSLPTHSHPGVEGAERVVACGTQSPGPGLQKHSEYEGRLAGSQA